MSISEAWREYRNLAWLVAAVLAVCLLGSVVYAQSVPGTLRLSWTNPTTGCITGSSPPVCNQPLTGVDAVTAINVYISTSPIPDASTMAPTLALPASASTTTHTLQVQRGQTVYARVKAINSGGASAFSNQVSKLIAVPVIPGVPSSVTVEVEIQT